MGLLNEALDEISQDQFKKRLIQAITGAIESFEMKDDPILLQKVNRLVKEHLKGRSVRSMANSIEDLKALLNGLKGLK